MSRVYYSEFEIHDYVLSSEHAKNEKESLKEHALSELGYLYAKDHAVLDKVEYRYWSLMDQKFIILPEKIRSGALRFESEIHRYRLETNKRIL